MSNRKNRNTGMHGKYVFISLLLIFLTACGGSGTPENENTFEASLETVQTQENEEVKNIRPEKEWVYVPETLMEEEMLSLCSNRMRLTDDEVWLLTMMRESLAHTVVNNQKLVKYNLNTKEAEYYPLDWPEGEDYWLTGNIGWISDSELWMISQIDPADATEELRTFLTKFSMDGKCTFAEEMTGDREFLYAKCVTDPEGRLYIIPPNDPIRLYDTEGNPCGTIEHEKWYLAQVAGTAQRADGSFCVCLTYGGDSGKNKCTLISIDFENQKLTTVVEKFPVVDGFCAGNAMTEPYEYLLYDGRAVYGYDLDTEEKEELFAWSDLGISGQDVRILDVREDGRILVWFNDWKYADYRMMLLTKTRAEDVPPVENLVLATVKSNNELNSLAAHFNRKNPNFHLEIKEYGSMTDLYNAMLVKESIDLIDLSGVNIRKMNGQGIFADLKPYLEGSSMFRRADFVDGILEAYTFDDVLVGIPDTFTLKTIMGDRSWAANGKGLTLEDLLELHRQNPGARVIDSFDGMGREDVMEYLMLFNEDRFIDWDSGRCSFDSEAFEELLKLVKDHPEEGKVSKDESSLPARVQNGEALLIAADLEKLRDIQMYGGIYGEDYASLGFPTADGAGRALLVTGTVYGMTASSEHKEGAWKFIESVIRQRNITAETPVVINGKGKECFPALQKTMEDLIEKRKGAEEGAIGAYQTFEDGWWFQFHTLTDAEAEMYYGIIRNAKPYWESEGDSILNIIYEEAPAFYTGQKSARDVARIIQSRAELYVTENLR